MNIEVGDLVRYRDNPIVWQVYQFWRNKVLVVDTQDDNHELEVFPENLTVVYTFFDLCRAWDDARERGGLLWTGQLFADNFDRIWGSNCGPDGYWLSDIYVDYVRRNTPLPQHLAWVHSFTTER